MIDIEKLAAYGYVPFVDPPQAGGFDELPLSKEEVDSLPNFPSGYFLNHPLGQFTNAVLRDLIAAGNIAKTVDHVASIPDAGHGDGITPEYILLGLLRNNDTSAARALRALGVDPSHIKTALQAAMDGQIPLSSGKYFGIFHPQSVTVLDDAFQLGSRLVMGAHVLASIAGYSGIATNVLHAAGITMQGVLSVLSGNPSVAPSA